jgi:hypothetical protein
VKLNHFTCPVCGHDFYANGSYATCDACQCWFYLSQSAVKTLINPTFNGIRFVNTTQTITINGEPPGVWFERVNNQEKH